MIDFTKTGSVKLESSKREISKMDKLKILHDHAILDPSNVFGIFPLIGRDDEVHDEIESHFGTFKKIENPEITMKLNNIFYGEVISINGTKYSKDFIDDIKKRGSIMFSGNPEIYMGYDKEKKEWLKDFPVLLLFDKLCFILAPRVETED